MWQFFERRITHEWTLTLKYEKPYDIPVYGPPLIVEVLPESPPWTPPTSDTGLNLSPHLTNTCLRNKWKRVPLGSQLASWYAMFQLVFLETRFLKHLAIDPRRSTCKTCLSHYHFRIHIDPRVGAYREAQKCNLQVRLHVIQPSFQYAIFKVAGYCISSKYHLMRNIPYSAQTLLWI
jgi:hypothetical protein